jgi:hypothetical protein
METAIQRVPLLQIKGGWHQHAQHIRMLDKGVEHYRRILTSIGDKACAQHLHQKLLRQLAEVLLRGVPDGCYTPAARSPAVAHKVQQLRFYMGADVGYFVPANRAEELLLALAVSEALASRDTVLSRAPDAHSVRQASVLNVNAVHNLIAVVLSSLRQYHLLAGLFEKAMKFAYEDRFIWCVRKIVCCIF